jgi:hypothetical protein
MKSLWEFCLGDRIKKILLKRKLRKLESILLQKEIARLEKHYKKLKEDLNSGYLFFASERKQLKDEIKEIEEKIILIQNKIKCENRKDT